MPGFPIYPGSPTILRLDFFRARDDVGFSVVMLQKTVISDKFKNSRSEAVSLEII
jgi:hypothetical protein